MNGLGTTAVQRGRIVLAALAVLFAGPLAAQNDEDGSFEIREASLTLRNGVYFLTASADLNLSAEGREALASGVPLSISYELEFLNRLRLWWDTEAAVLRQRYQIEFQTLTERYSVTNQNTDERTMFADLDAALQFIGRIDDLPALDAALLDSDRRYDIRLRVLLDTERLPGPLRLLAFWRRDWSLGSDWEQWRLDEE